VSTDVQPQPRLLVVETVPRGTEALRHALSVAGYYVALAAGESEAMRIVGTGAPDAIIVDLPPCEKTAVDVYKRLRAKEKDLPLLVLSPGHSVLESLTELDPASTTTWCAHLPSASFWLACAPSCVENDSRGRLRSASPT
jgi:CheY-like chemotaxis protein